MSNRKITFRFFDIMDYEKEADYLSEMHRKGWKFTYVTLPGIYHFEKCEPEEVRYQLDYNAEGLKHAEEYQQMFADMGWEYILDFVGYSYFRKQVTEEMGDEEIFCDDESRLDMMKRMFRGRVIPLIVIFFLCIVPALVFCFANIGTERAQSSGTIICAVLVCLLYVSIFVRFSVRYFAFIRKMGRSI